MNLEARFSPASPDYVRLWKVGAADRPDHEPGDPATFPLGTPSPSDESLPVGYVLEGWLLKKPVVGEHVEVLRVARNGVPVLGYFTSSKVVELEAGGFRTRNSLYLLTIIPHDPPPEPDRTKNE